MGVNGWNGNTFDKTELTGGNLPHENIPPYIAGILLEKIRIKKLNFDLKKVLINLNN
jgi:hypothetical protein